MKKSREHHRKRAATTGGSTGGCVGGRRPTGRRLCDAQFASRRARRSGGRDRPRDPALRHACSHTAQRWRLRSGSRGLSREQSTDVVCNLFAATAYRFDQKAPRSVPHATRLRCRDTSQSGTPPRRTAAVTPRWFFDHRTACIFCQSSRLSDSGWRPQYRPPCIVRFQPSRTGVCSARSGNICLILQHRSRASA